MAGPKDILQKLIDDKETIVSSAPAKQFDSEHPRRTITIVGRADLIKELEEII